MMRVSSIPFVVGCGLLVAGWSLIVGCSSEKSLYPEDSARFLRIDRAIETLRSAYVQKDISAIEDLSIPLERIEELKEAIRQDFETFQTIELDFSIDRIMIDGHQIEVFLHWRGTWTVKPADPGIRERGHGMLRWVGVHSILLQHVEGDLPFGMAGRNLASTRSPDFIP